MTEILRELKKEDDPDIEEFPVTAENLGKMITLIDKGTISGKIAKKVFAEMMASGKDPDTIIKEKGLVQISDTDSIKPLIQEVLDENPDTIEKYKSGNTKVIGFLVGQAMRKTKGKANPGVVNKILMELLNQ